MIFFCPYTKISSTEFLQSPVMIQVLTMGALSVVLIGLIPHISRPTQCTLHCTTNTATHCTLHSALYTEGQCTAHCRPTYCTLHCTALHCTLHAHTLNTKVTLHCTVGGFRLQWENSKVFFCKSTLHFLVSLCSLIPNI